MRYFFLPFICVCVAHLSEHIAQAIQVYALDMPLHEAGGRVCLFYSWLVHSEVLYYGYVATMLVGLFAFRKCFTGASRWWWMLAFGIQFRHHFEHALLLWQASTGHIFLGPHNRSALFSSLHVTSRGLHLSRGVSRNRPYILARVVDGAAA